MMNIDDLTVGQARQLATMFPQQTDAARNSLNGMIGEKVIVRTYAAGVWFGSLEEKAGSEVIISHARRMWAWWAEQSISLSGVARHGIKHENSKIAPAVERVWMEAIEIIPCTSVAISSIEEAPDAQAQ